MASADFEDDTDRRRISKTDDAPTMDRPCTPSRSALLRVDGGRVILIDRINTNQMSVCVFLQFVRENNVFFTPSIIDGRGRSFEPLQRAIRPGHATPGYASVLTTDSTRRTIDEIKETLESFRTKTKLEKDIGLCGTVAKYTARVHRDKCVLERVDKFRYSETTIARQTRQERPRNQRRLAKAVVKNLNAQTSKHRKDSLKHVHGAQRLPTSRK